MLVLFIPSTDRSGRPFGPPVIVHRYTTPDDIQDESKLRLVAGFCRRMGRETNQGEVGLLVSDEYIAITQFDEE